MNAVVCLRFLVDMNNEMFENNEGENMRFILQGKAQQHPEIIGMLTEEVLLDPNQANMKLNPFHLAIERIEKVDGETVVYIKENNSNILCG